MRTAVIVSLLVAVVLGAVTDDDIHDLQKKAARLGGDVALLDHQE